MPRKRTTKTSLAIEVGGLAQEVRGMKGELAGHIKEEHEWLMKLEDVTTRLNNIATIKVNGNVGLEAGLKDIYQKTEKISTQVSELHDVLQAQIDRRRFMDDLTRWMEHSTLGKWLTTKWAKTIWLIILGILLWEHQQVADFLTRILQ